MIERQFINQKLKERYIQEYLKEQFAKTGYSHAEIKRTPLGEKIIIYTTRPGIVVGRKGENIQRLTQTLKKKFKMENPQIEIGEVINQMLDVNYVADRIVSTLERFGSKRFKSVGYKTLQEVMDSGALGAEIVISGKVPSARARSWRFSAGYLKKSGDIAANHVSKAYGAAKLKSGIIGVQVRIMLPDVILPDLMKLKETQETKQEVKKEQPKAVAEEKTTEKKDETKENGNNKEE